MYGIQLDQLAAVLGATPRRAAAQVTRWRAAGTADSGVLSAGPRWVWLTRAGLAACGLPYRAEHARVIEAGAPAGRDRCPARLRRYAPGQRRRSVLAQRAQAQGQDGRQDRTARARTRRRAALAGQRGAPLGRRVLGDRGRAHAEDGCQDGCDHARGADPHRGLRLPGGGCPCAGPASPPHQGDLPVHASRPAGREPGQGRPRRPGRTGRGAVAARGRRARRPWLARQRQAGRQPSGNPRRRCGRHDQALAWPAGGAGHAPGGGRAAGLGRPRPWPRSPQRR